MIHIFLFFRVVILCFETFFKFVQIASWMILIKKPGVGWMPYFRAHCSDWSSPKILHQVRRSWNWCNLGSLNFQRQRFSVNIPSRCCYCYPTSRSSASGLWNRYKEWCFSMNHSGAEHRQPDRKSVRRSEPHSASSFEGLRFLMLNANDGEWKTKAERQTRKTAASFERKECSCPTYRSWFREECRHFRQKTPENYHHLHWTGQSWLHWWWIRHWSFLQSPPRSTHLGSNWTGAACGRNPDIPSQNWSDLREVGVQPKTLHPVRCFQSIPGTPFPGNPVWGWSR